LLLVQKILAFEKFGMYIACRFNETNNVMKKSFLSAFKNYSLNFLGQSSISESNQYYLSPKLKILAFVFILVNSSLINAQQRASVTKLNFTGKWNLFSAEVLNPSSREVLNAETFLFRDIVKHKTPITFKDDGAFIFQKDGIAQNWKFRIKENGLVHLIEYEKTDSKGEKSSAYIDYNYEVNGSQLKLFRKDNASEELYIFSLIK